MRLSLAALLWWRPADAGWVLTLVALTAVSGAASRRLAPVFRRRLDEHERAGVWIEVLCDEVFVVSALLAVWAGGDVSLGIVTLALAGEIGVVLLAATDQLAPELRDGLRGNPPDDWRGSIDRALQFSVVAAIFYAPGAAWSLAAGIAALGIARLSRDVWRAVRASRVRWVDPLGRW